MPLIKLCSHFLPDDQHGNKTESLKQITVAPANLQNLIDHSYSLTNTEYNSLSSTITGGVWKIIECHMTFRVNQNNVGIMVYNCKIKSM